MNIDESNTKEEAPPLEELVFYKEVLERDKETNEISHWNSKHGKKGSSPLYYYPWIDFNLFSTVEQPVLENYEVREPPDENWVRQYMTSPSRTRAVPYQHTEEGERWLVLDNGGRPFLVIENGVDVYVYSHDPNRFLRNIDRYSDHCWYSLLLGQFKNVNKIWIGKSEKTPMTEWSGGYGPEFDGNSILLEVSHGSYVFIGHVVYSFDFPESISAFYAPVGNNDVPYPTAETDTWFLFMLDLVAYKKEQFLRTTDEDSKAMNDLYFDFYGHGGHKQNGEKIDFINVRTLAEPYY
ncbi:MAG: hypothetical protein H7A25_05855 [Leptospiraceae bacterium]|nr:hypothetical protein [Leptospiraceae bacterium]MCP5499406.1 hypothetical protein [Leptospiraceae bacterium]